jgi:hypothetical protein
MWVLNVLKCNDFSNDSSGTLSTIIYSSVSLSPRCLQTLVMNTRPYCSGPSLLLLLDEMSMMHRYLRLSLRASRSYYGVSSAGHGFPAACRSASSSIFTRKRTSLTPSQAPPAPSPYTLQTPIQPFSPQAQPLPQSQPPPQVAPPQQTSRPSTAQSDRHAPARKYRKYIS